MKTLIISLTCFLVICCSDETTVVTPENTTYSQVHFDLQTGFEGYQTSISIDSSNAFSALLSELSPLAGPQASFTVQLEKGSHELFIYGSFLKDRSNWFTDSSKFFIGDSANYYVGIANYPDTLIINVRSYPFLYL